jgi:hypothetical protein
MGIGETSETVKRERRRVEVMDKDNTSSDSPPQRPSARGQPKLDDEAKLANDEGRSADGDDEDAEDDGIDETLDNDSLDEEALRQDEKYEGRKAKKKTKPKSQASLLVELAMKECRFFHDEFDVAYASLAAPHGEHGEMHRETHRLKGKSFALWLRRAYYISYAAAPSADSVRTACATLEAFALFDGPLREVFTRTATHGGKLYVDIGDNIWWAYEVDADGWRIVDDPPVYFTRSSSMLPLVEATRGDPKAGIAKLKKLTRIRDEEDFVVVVGFLLAALAGLHGRAHDPGGFADVGLPVRVERERGRSRSGDNLGLAGHVISLARASPSRFRPLLARDAASCADWPSNDDDWRAFRPASQRSKSAPVSVSRHAATASACACGSLGQRPHGKNSTSSHEASSARLSAIGGPSSIPALVGPYWQWAFPCLAQTAHSIRSTLTISPPPHTGQPCPA